MRETFFIFITSSFTVPPFKKCYHPELDSQNSPPAHMKLCLLDLKSIPWVEDTLPIANQSKRNKTALMELSQYLYKRGFRWNCQLSGYIPSWKYGITEFKDGKHLLGHLLHFLCQFIIALCIKFSSACVA